MRILRIGAVALLFATSTATAQDAQPVDMDRASYAVGVSVGMGFAQQSIELVMEQFQRGVQDGLAGNSELNDEELREMISALQAKMQQRRAEAQRVKGEANLADSARFLEQNGARAGVVTLDSGVQYEVVTAGDGESPALADTVTVNYRGSLIDGTEFDSSHSRGKPLEMPISRAVKGWQEAIPMMTVGSTWKLYIPAEHGYGERGSGALIGPNAALVFEVELLGFKRADAATE